MAINQVDHLLPRLAAVSAFHQIAASCIREVARVRHMAVVEFTVGGETYHAIASAFRGPTLAHRDPRDVPEGEGHLADDAALMRRFAALTNNFAVGIYVDEAKWLALFSGCPTSAIQSATQSELANPRYTFVPSLSLPSDTVDHARSLQNNLIAAYEQWAVAKAAGRRMQTVPPISNHFDTYRGEQHVAKWHGALTWAKGLLAMTYPRIGPQGVRNYASIDVTEGWGWHGSGRLTAYNGGRANDTTGVMLANPPNLCTGTDVVAATAETYQRQYGPGFMNRSTLQFIASKWTIHGLPWVPASAIITRVVDAKTFAADEFRPYVADAPPPQCFRISPTWFGGMMSAGRGGQSELPSLLAYIEREEFVVPADVRRWVAALDDASVTDPISKEISIDQWNARMGGAKMRCFVARTGLKLVDSLEIQVAEYVEGNRFTLIGRSGPNVSERTFLWTRDGILAACDWIIAHDVPFVTIVNRPAGTQWDEFLRQWEYRREQAFEIRPAADAKPIAEDHRSITELASDDQFARVAEGWWNRPDAVFASMAATCEVLAAPAA